MVDQPEELRPSDKLSASSFEKSLALGRQSARVQAESERQAAANSLNKAKDSLRRQEQTCAHQIAILDGVRRWFIQSRFRSRDYVSVASSGRHKLSGNVVTGTHGEDIMDWYIRPFDGGDDLHAYSIGAKLRGYEITHYGFKIGPHTGSDHHTETFLAALANFSVERLGTGIGALSVEIGIPFELQVDGPD